MSIWDTSQSLDGLPLVALRKVCVPQGHLQGLVAEEFLDGHQVGAVHDEVAGKGAAQVVKTKVVDTRSPAGVTEGLANVTNGLAIPTVKDIGVLRGPLDFSERDREVLVRFHDSALAVLGVPDNKLISVQVNIVPLQIEDFTESHSCVNGSDYNRSELRRAFLYQPLDFFGSQMAPSSIVLFEELNASDRIVGCHFP